MIGIIGLIDRDSLSIFKYKKNDRKYDNINTIRSTGIKKFN